MFKKDKKELLIEFINNISDNINVSFDKIINGYNKNLFMNKEFYNIRNKYKNGDITIDEYIKSTKALIREVNKHE